MEAEDSLFTFEAEIIILCVQLELQPWYFRTPLVADEQGCGALPMVCRASSCGAGALKISLSSSNYLLLREVSF